MANPPHNTYISIPPPPLPEFYMPKKTTVDAAASACSGTDEIEATATSKASKTVFERVNERRQHSAIPGDGTDERQEYVRRRAGSDITSSLAVYHICRICHRPRSARYHREHPIPVDGLPPPPGICRRCRVTSVEDSISMADVVEHHESHGPKLGVKCLVEDRDYLSADKARSRRVEYDGNQVEWSELEPPPRKQSPPQQTEYIYRHIHVAVPPPPIHPPLPQAVVSPTASPSEPEPMYTYVPKPSAKSTAQDAIDSMSVKSAHSGKRTQYEIRRVKERVPVESSTTARSDLRYESKKAVSSSSKAKAEVEIRSSSERGGSSRPEWTEKDIRRLARDEVERYRQAERKMEAHGDAYAHGRMVPVERVPVVPVERRIEAQREVVDEMPWKRQPDAKPAEKVSGTTKREYRVRSESQSGREEILVVRKSGRKPHVEEPWSRPEASLPSEASSDKTRWPSRQDFETRTSRYQQGKDAASTHTPVNAKVGHWVDFEQPRRRTEVHERKLQVNDTETEYVRSTRRPEHHHYQRVAVESDRRDSALAGLAQDVGKQTVQQRTQEALLPYPGDEMAVPMPSPSSHASRPAKAAVSRGNDGEYYYKLRTVQPADEVAHPRNEIPGDYYKETSEYIHRRKAPSEARQPEQSAMRTKEGNRRQSDASSRVRFATKVAVSPTPPGSDASSARFNDLPPPVYDPRVPDDYIELGPGRRGRTPNHIPQNKQDYFYERDPYSARQRQDEGGVPRPAMRGRRPSGETETATAASTVPLDVRMMARVRSESPSREKLLKDARRQRQDGFGPYAAMNDRSVSVEAYDGSSVGGSDREPPKQYRERCERRERRQHSGQQSRR